MSNIRKFASLAAVAVSVALWQVPADAEGLVATPWGWRAAPCCRSYGFPGFQGRPPNEFIYGVLAPVFWGEIVPRLLERLPPPAYAYAPPRPPAYRPPPPEMAQPAPPAPPPPEAAPALDREQWKQRLLSEGRKFCEQYPDDPVCGR